jgi:Rab-GTPase-TBC domain
MGSGCCSKKNKVATMTLDSQWRFFLEHHKLETLAETEKQKISELMYKGVPSSLRWEVWYKYFKTENLKTEYETLLENTTIHSDIEKDINRTLPSNKWLSSEPGQLSLKKILHALSQKYSVNGYWQGMNYIVATVLILSIGNEHETFNFINKLYKDFGVISLFEEKFLKIQEFCKLFHKSLEKYDEELESHIKSIGLDDSLWIFKWFITMFTYSFSIKTVWRIWDALFTKSLSFVCNISLSIALSISTTIKSNNLEGILKILDGLEIDVEEVILKADVYIIENCEGNNNING